MTCSKEDAYNRVQFKLLIDLLIQYGVSLTLTRWVAGAKSEVLRSLRHYLRAQSQGHHTIDRLEERGVERESARRSFSKVREMAIVSQRRGPEQLRLDLNKSIPGVDTFSFLEEILEFD